MLETRASGEEFLDRPDCDPALAAASYRFMERVNRHFGGVAVVRRFVEAEAAARPRDRPLRMLDIGSGGCDIPLALSRWARGRGLPLAISCLEKARPAAALARGNLERAGDPAVRLVREDVFAHVPDAPYDCASASLCVHHFPDPLILALLERLRGQVRGGVLINDLRRSVAAWLGAGLLLAAAPAGVRHDALLSIRKGFKVNELRALLGRVPGVAVRVEPAPWFRLAAVVHYTGGGAP